jgi:hypothetical protein
MIKVKVKLSLCLTKHHAMRMATESKEFSMDWACNVDGEDKEMHTGFCC